MEFSKIVFYRYTSLSTFILYRCRFFYSLLFLEEDIYYCAFNILD